jgi:hypothetical protein
MGQKTIWMRYSQHMNKLLLIFVLILSSCESTIEEKEWDINI